MNPNGGIEAGDRVVIVLFAFLGRNGTLADANANPRLLLLLFTMVAGIATVVIVGMRYGVGRVIGTPLTHHSNEIHVSRVSSGNVALLFFCSSFLAL